MDLHELNDVQDKFMADLKTKTIWYMLENQYQIMSDPKILETSMTDDEEVFNIYVKYNDEVIMHRGLGRQNDTHQRLGTPLT